MLAKIRDNVWRFILKRKELIFFLIVTIISIIVRKSTIEYVSGDMYWCLREWYNDLKAGGGFAALKNNIGNYNVPYLVIIAFLTYLPISCDLGLKIVSIIFDYILAISSMVLVKKLTKNNPHKMLFPLLTYGIVLMLPSMIYNSACWGQCDSIYVVFGIIALLFLIDEKYVRAFIFLGISFAFKLQSIFILPVFLLVYIQKRKFSLALFLIIPIVNLILCSPALIAGRSFGDVAKIYINQVSEYESRISLNAPSIHNIYLKPSSDNMTYAPNDYVGKIWTCTALVIFGIAAFVSLYKKKDFDKNDILSLSLWSVMLCMFLLPSMHERYGFFADILSVIWFMVNKEKIYIPIGINLISLCVYSNYLFGGSSIPLEYLSIAYLIILVIFSKEVFEKHLNIEMEE